MHIINDEMVDLTREVEEIRLIISAAVWWKR